MRTWLVAYSTPPPHSTDAYPIASEQEPYHSASCILDIRAEKQLLELNGGRKKEGGVGHGVQYTMRAAGV
eukprot:gene4010-biopygen1963